MPLTDTKVKNAKPQAKPYILQDGNGLYLEVRPSGTKFWRYRYWLTPKKDGRYTIGEYPHVSLADARKERERARELVKKGLNPTDVRKVEKQASLAEDQITFKLVAQEWLERKKQTWAKGTYDQNELFLSVHCYPDFGDRPILSIKAHDILKVLRRLESRGTHQSALKVRQICSAVFCYAVATLRAETDPAAPLRGAIIAPKAVNSRCLTAADLKKYFASLASYGGHIQTKLALMLLPLVFVRQNELRSAKWEQFDLDNALWTIPAGSMKMGRAHSVPLSPTAIKILKQAKTAFPQRELVFPGIKKPLEPLGNSTLNRAIVYLGFQPTELTCHDFRATASTTLYEMGYRGEIIEKQLAHVETNTVIAAYNHAEYLNERRNMMNAYDEWLTQFMPHDFVSVIPDNV